MTIDPADLRSAIERHLTARDRSAALKDALAAVASGMTLPCLYSQVLGPLMDGVGDSWQAGRLAVWEEHFASSTVRTIVDALYPTVMATAPAERGRGTAVLACPCQEQHDLGLRMLADRMELAGWSVHFIGADTPADELAAAAAGLGADTVVLSVATHYHRVMLRTYVEKVRSLAKGVRVLVGGAAFDHDTEGWASDELASEAGLTAGEPPC